MIRYRPALETCTVLNMSACKNVLVGIDCGTLNTRLAVYNDKKTLKLRQFRRTFGSRRNTHWPECQSRTEERRIRLPPGVRKDPNDESVTDLMHRKDSYLVSDDNILHYKLLLKGEERKLRPELVLALFLDKVTDDDVSGRFNCPGALHTVPTTRPPRRAKVSKLNVPRLLTKSTAIAVAYFAKNLPIEGSRNVLVYHLDATSFKWLWYGGLHVNRLIYEAVKKEIDDPKFAMDGNLFRKIENAKRQLLDSQEGIIELPKYDDYQYNLTRDDFDSLLEKEVVTPTMRHVDEALKSCGLTGAQVHEVVLSGGHSNATVIKARLARDFRVYDGCSAAVGALYFCSNLKKPTFEVREPVELHIQQKDSTVEVTQRNEPEPQIRIECAVDANGLCDVTVRQPKGLTESEVEELRFEKEALLRQNVELQKIKEAHSELRLAEHRFGAEMERLNVPKKYKVMFGHLCDSAAGVGLEAYVRKRVVLENYVRYVRTFDRDEDIYDYLTTTK